MKTITLKEFWDNDLVSNESLPIKFEGDASFVGGKYNVGRRLWHDGGTTSIPLDDISSYDKLEERCKIYAKGNYTCCRCCKEINGKDGSSYVRFFAGVYCKDCWTPRDQKRKDWAYSHLD